MNILNYHNIAICGVLLTACVLLASCSGSDGDAAENPAVPTTDVDDNSIRFNAGVWRMIQGAPRRATTYTTGTLTSGSFTAAAYVDNSTTEYISPVTVDWVADKWVFSDGKHYWPTSGDLDFFAYMPATPPSYICNMSDVSASVTYTARNPQFKCVNLPMTYNGASPTEGQGSDLQEFVYDIQTGQNKTTPGASGVTLSFKHPFAKIKMQLAESHPAITINKITFKSIKNNGTFTHNGSPSTWAISGSATDLVVTLDQAFSTSVSAQAIGPDFIMIPQQWTGNIEVQATWTDWGDQLKHTVTATVPTVTWAPGTSYTYTFTIRETDLVVNTTKYTEQW